MLHACFVYDPTCFMCIFIQYLSFLGTNLLTRCHGVSSCFLLFLYFRKDVQEIFSELHGTNCQYLKITMKTVPEGHLKGGRQVARHHPGAAQPWPAPGCCMGSPGRPRLRLFAHIISISRKP